VTLIALQLRVPTCQRKADRIVIKAGRLPGGGRMTILAGLRKSEGYVIRVTGFLEIGQVAADASRGSPRVLAAGMTGAAV